MPEDNQNPSLNAGQVFKWVYLVFGLLTIIIAFTSFLLFSSGIERGENTLNGLIIFSPIILSGLLVVISSLLLFWKERVKIQAAFSVNKANIWLVSIILLLVLLGNLAIFFINHKFFDQTAVVLLFTLFSYPILIAMLAFGQNKFKVLLAEVALPGGLPTKTGKLTSIVLVIVIVAAVFLLLNLLYPSVLFGDAVGMAGWVVGLALGVSLLFLAPVLLILSAARLKQDNKDKSS